MQFVSDIADRRQARPNGQDTGTDQRARFESDPPDAAVGYFFGKPGGFDRVAPG